MEEQAAAKEIAETAAGAAHKTAEQEARTRQILEDEVARMRIRSKFAEKEAAAKKLEEVAARQAAEQCAAHENAEEETVGNPFTCFFWN